MSDLLSKLCEMGRQHDIYLVGGYLRDWLLRRESKDLDLAVAGDPRPVAKELADGLGGSLVTLDEETSTYRVVLPDQTQLDFTPIRDDLESDLRRRDFTINALALPLSAMQSGRFPAAVESQLIDPTGGITDLREKRVRHCYPQAFQDDPVRLLRAIRFCATLGLSLAAATEEEIRKQADLLRQAAAERIREELFLILEQEGCAPYLDQIRDLGLLPIISPELAALVGLEQGPPHHLDVWRHSLATIEELESLTKHPEDWAGAWADQVGEALARTIGGGHSSRTLLKFVALVHDLGKAPDRSIDEDGRIRFIGHQESGAEMAKQLARRLRLSSKEVGMTERLVRAHLRPGFLAEAPELSHRAIFRFLRDLDDLIAECLALSLADRTATIGDGLQSVVSGAEPLQESKHREVVDRLLGEYFNPASPTRPQKLIDGREIMARYGIPEGREVGRLLKALEEAQVEQGLREKEEAWRFLDQLVEGGKENR